MHCIDALIKCYLLFSFWRPEGGVPRKRCSENMQQIYRRTPMPKSNFIETLLKSHFDMGVLQ